MASLTDVFSCPICLERYDIPRALPCLHTFCEKCLVDWVKHRSVNDSAGYIRGPVTFPCPVCKENIQVPPEGVRGFKHNFFLSSSTPAPSDQAANQRRASTSSEDLEVDRERVCFRCEEVGVAKVCLRCVDWLCPPCCTDHTRVKATRAHILATHKELLEFVFAENIVSDNLSFCTEEDHGACLMEHYCVTCKKLVCVRCKADLHIGNTHPTLCITSKVTDVRLSLIEHVEKVQQKEEELTRHRKELDKTKTDIWARHRAAIKDMDKTIHIIHKIIKSVRARTCKEIKQKLVENMKPVEDESSGVSNTLSVISAVEDNMKAMLEEGKDHVLMTDAPVLCQQAMESIKDNGKCVSIQVMVPEWKPADKESLENTITRMLSAVKYKNKCYELGEQTSNRNNRPLSGSVMDMNLLDLSDTPAGAQRRSSRKKKKLENRCPSLTLPTFTLAPDTPNSSVSDFDEPCSPNRQDSIDESQQLDTILQVFDPLGDDWRDLPQLPPSNELIDAPDEGNSSSCGSDHEAEQPADDFLSEPPPPGPFYPTGNEPPTSTVESPMHSLPAPSPRHAGHRHRPPHQHLLRPPPGPPDQQEWGMPGPHCPPHHHRHGRHRHPGPHDFPRPRHPPPGWHGGPRGNWFR